MQIALPPVKPTAYSSVQSWCQFLGTNLVDEELAAAKNGAKCTHSNPQSSILHPSLNLQPKNHLTAKTTPCPFFSEAPHPSLLADNSALYQLRPISFSAMPAKNQVWRY
jgi:hypothetical protein